MPTGFQVQPRDHLGTIASCLRALSSVEERPFRIREVEGSNPSVSTLFSSTLSVAQLVEHVTVDICDHRVAGSIPAAETLCGQAVIV